jgi:hypothetical protein
MHSGDKTTGLERSYDLRFSAQIIRPAEANVTESTDPFGFFCVARYADSRVGFVLPNHKF